MRSIEITFKPDGTYKKETHGFNGKACEKASEFIDQALAGGKPRTRHRKPEYHATVTQNKSVQVG